MIFLEAARLVLDAGHDVEFVIASQGSQQIALRHRAQRLRDRRARHGGRLSHRRRRSSGRVLDIYCQPAVVASTGRTLMQALAHAVPCIATNVQGLRALIDSGRKRPDRPPRRSDRASNRRSSPCSTIPEEARRLGRTAFERARTRFDPDVEADRLADLYREVAASCAIPKSALL